jgi:hypothetical protein
VGIQVFLFFFISPLISRHLSKERLNLGHPIRPLMSSEIKQNYWPHLHVKKGKNLMKRWGCQRGWRRQQSFLLPGGHFTQWGTGTAQKRGRIIIGEILHVLERLRTGK